jgi:predicted house-cleaning noncanonical NTP pyrophosphatase (MazG superfamily)
MKLVRDRIPEIIIEDGKTPIYHIAEAEEFKRELFRKVVEELEEFREEPCLEEAADLIEVIYTLVEAHGLMFGAIVDTGIAKSEITGGFSRGVILERVE